MTAALSSVIVPLATIAQHDAARHRHHMLVDRRSLNARAGEMRNCHFSAARLPANTARYRFLDGTHGFSLSVLALDWHNRPLAR
jgi:hypothetical protein